MDQPNLHTMNFFQRIACKTGLFFQNLPSAAARGCSSAARSVGRFFSRLGGSIAGFFTIFARGDIFTKLSYFIMGLGNMVRGQIVKGILYLGCEAGIIYYMVSFGWNYLKDIGTLGVNAETQYVDPTTGLIMYGLADNSMLILLYSVMTLILLAAFLAIYVSSVQSAYTAQQYHEQGRPLPGLRGDIKALGNERYHVTLLTLPTLMATAFVILPLIFMVLIAFTNYDKVHQPPGSLFTWVGLQNFRDIFGDNPTKTYTFSYLLRWTLVWALLATFTNYIFGMILAIIINRKGIKLKKLWRTIFVLTIAVPQFVSLLMISKMFGDQGPVNLILTKYLGMDMVPFLTNGAIARVMVVIINMWVGIPYSMLICTGILMNIPTELYESAKIDGASAFKTFTKITLPYMLFVTTPYLITQFVGNFNNFNVIYLLTQGNPKSVWLYQAGETDLLVTWLYKLTVDQQDYNLASVIGILVFAISAILSLIVYNSSGSVKKEEDFQ